MGKNPFPPRRAGVSRPSAGIAILLLLLFLFAGGCGRGGQENPSASASSSPGGGGETEQAVPVRVVSPFRGEIAESIRTSGTLEADREADVYAKLVGLCQKVFVEEGDQVKAGDVLAKLEDEELRLTCEQARARLEKARADYDRADQLYKEGLASQQAYQDASVQLRLAQADYDLARKRLEDTSIVSPLAGLVTARKIKPGDLVTTNQALFHIVDLDPLRVEVYVPERDYYRIRQGQTVLLTVDTFPGTTFRSTVERLNPVIDTASGMAKVTVVVENADRRLRPGMFARVQIVTEVRKEALLVPKEAILLRGDQNFVFVVRDGVAREVPVEIGFQEADRVEVLKGLASEDEVVVQGQLRLQNETRVRIVSEPRG